MPKTRSFKHRFDPENQNPVSGQDVHLSVQEIERAGLLEVVQTPGAGLGSWAIFGNLLQPDKRFVFREPLGQAREVKVALSGLFGRFVARAYLEKYFNLSIFAHLGESTIDLNGRRKVQIKKCSDGDLPDWIACARNLTSLTVAEAKGCYDRSGPNKAVKRAWDQVGRADIFEKGNRVTVKRIAVATRWGMHTGGPPEPWIAVRDPIDEGSSIMPDDEEAIFIGLVRHHIANMISPLGYTELAQTLWKLSSVQSERDYQQFARRAFDQLETATVRGHHLSTKDSEFSDIIGGVATRAGPLIDAVLSSTDIITLERFDLNPVLIGVDRELVIAAIEEDFTLMQTVLAKGSTTGEEDYTGHAAGRIIQLAKLTIP